MSALEAAADVICRSATPTICSEEDLQAWLGELFEQHGFRARQEVQLSASDRVDFLVDGTAIECKVGGSQAAALRQLQRYAESDQVEDLLLVSTRRMHTGLPTTIRGKPLQVVWVNTL